MKNKINIFFFLFFIVCASPVFALDVTQEQQEKILEEAERALTDFEKDQEKKARPRRAFTYGIKVSGGHDNNPKSSGIRKGDWFQKLKLNTRYRKTVAERNQFIVNADINVINYSEITDLSNYLGHANLTYKIAYTKEYVFGMGYDFSFADYPLNNATDFTFHKVFMNAQYRMSKELYHEVKYQRGMKLFWDAKALGPASSSSLQEKERKDIRDTIDYTLGYTMSGKLQSTFRLRAERNNANAIFQKYHDYHSFNFTPRLSYKFNDKLSGSSSLSYTYKIFDDRIAAGRNEEQIDQLYSPALGLKYKTSKHSSFSLDYTYKQNESNDNTAQYTGRTIEMGWKLNF